jgi:hypothetical protein
MTAIIFMNLLNRQNGFYLNFKVKPWIFQASEQVVGQTYGKELRSKRGSLRVNHGMMRKSGADFSAKGAATGKK